MNKRKKDKYNVSDDDYGEETYGVASANDGTGIVPSEPRGEEELESYNSIAGDMAGRKNFKNSKNR